MLILLSPAKKLDFTQHNLTAFTAPSHNKVSRTLAATMREKSPQQLSKLSGLSSELAALNHKRWKLWNVPRKLGEDAKQAAFTFAGEVYRGLDPQSFTDEDTAYAQEHLRILSGLYGLLKPLDLIKPYRLEMGTSLASPLGASLYQAWSPLISKAIKAQLRKTQSRAILNLASHEYAKAAELETLAAKSLTKNLTAKPLQVITPKFLNRTAKGDYRTVMVFAKQARGSMAAWAIKHKITTPEAVLDFQERGYKYDLDSALLQPTFVCD